MSYIKMKTCEKCSYESEENKSIKLEDKEIYLCSICKQFAPSNNLQEYLQEKIDWKVLESFRKFQDRTKLKIGMQEKAKQGKIMSRAPHGYKLVNKELVLDEEKKLIVEEIFRTFLEQDISLNQLAKKFNLSVNGLKKILRNFTYMGKTKFAGQISQGKHQPLISSELFNKVQTKLEKLNI